MTTTPETPALPGDLTDYQHELVLNALDRLANQAILAAGATVLVPKDSAHIKAVRDAAAGDAELVRTALAAAPVAPSPVLTDETIERGARALAGLEPGEDWPTNEKLGGGPTGTRDDEYRDSMLEQASAVLAAARVAPVTPSEEHSGRVLSRDSLAVVLAPLLDRAMGDYGQGEDVQDEMIDAIMALVVTPAPSPNHQALIAEAERWPYPDEANPTLMAAPPADLIARLAAALAVPPVVNKAKLAEILTEHTPDRGGFYGCSCGWDDSDGDWDSHLAADLVERQREWLGKGR